MLGDHRPRGEFGAVEFGFGFECADASSFSAASLFFW